MPRLENWSVVTDEDNRFMAPELQIKRLHGNIYDDDRFPGGSSVTTSALRGMNLKNMTAETMNTKYDLGAVDASYKTFCEKNNISLMG